MTEFYLQDWSVAPATITFHNEKEGPVGTLYLENPVRFEGNADASAKVFFDCLKKLVTDSGYEFVPEVKNG